MHPYRPTLVNQGNPEAVPDGSQCGLLSCRTTANNDEIIFLRLLTLCGHRVAFLPEHP
jgi:hypothetical protein